MPLGWAGMIELFEGVPEGEVDPETASSVGWVYSALFVGLWTQRLIDPTAAPSGEVIADSLRRIVNDTVVDRDAPKS